MRSHEYQQIYPGDRLREGRSNLKRMAELNRDLINIADSFFLWGDRAAVAYLQGDRPSTSLDAIFRDKFTEWLRLSVAMSEMLHSIYDFRLTHGYDPTVWRLSPDGERDLNDLRTRGLVDQSGRTLPLGDVARLDSEF